MATGNLEVLDRGLGCPETMEELAMSMERSRKKSQEEEAKGGEKAEGREEMNSQEPAPAEDEQAPYGSREGGWRPSRGKAEKEQPEDQGKEGRAATAPKSAPARKKTRVQSQPQGKPQPRALGPFSDELPWGEITLNKCLALASVVAVLSMAFQVFQDVIDGEDEAAEAAPARWAWPGSRAPRDSGPKLPRAKDWAKASAPAPPPVPKAPEPAVVTEAPPKEAAPEEQDAEGKLRPGPAPEAAALPEDPPPHSKAAPPRKEEKAWHRKGSREERARKEGGQGPRPRREEAGEAPRRPWEREHRQPGRREDDKKGRSGARSKREEHRGRGGREDRDRFFPKHKHREGKRRD